MSRKDIEEFYSLVSKDAGVRQSIYELDKKYPIKVNEVDKDAVEFLIEKEIIPIAKYKGLSFTSEELMDFLNEKRETLGKDDLLNVSGGISPKQALIGLSGVLLLSFGAGAGVLSIAKSIDRPKQKIEQQKVVNKRGKNVTTKSDKINAPQNVSSVRTIGDKRSNVDKA